MPLHNPLPLLVAALAALLPGLCLGIEIRPAIIPYKPEALSPALPTEMTRGPQGLHQVALTFDAGSEADAFPALLQILDRLQVKATFFLTGKWAQRYPKETQMLVERQHAIGNHSWAHPEYTRLSNEFIKLDLLAADALLDRRFGQPIRPLFRPPYGDRDGRVFGVLRESGYMSVYWSIDTLDAMDPRKSPAFIERRVLQHSNKDLDGAIILAHVGYPETCEAMPSIIAGLRVRGFEFVTLRDWVRP
jgi:peptidoglycan-N-acetylglucosamine deacetylase